MGKKGTKLIRSKKTIVDGHEFDSQAEAIFYKKLLEDEKVDKIELQPKFILLNKFTVPCWKCRGTGKMASSKTNKNINCSSCKGTKVRQRQPWTYSADFKVTYRDGYVEIIDVKGGFKDAKFPYVKKMFEYTTGKELVVWSYKQKKWTRSK